MFLGVLRRTSVLVFCISSLALGERNPVVTPEVASELACSSLSDAQVQSVLGQSKPVTGVTLVGLHTTLVTGYRAEIMTPENWVAMKAADSKRKYTNFTTSDVKPDDRLCVLRINVDPDLPKFASRDSVNQAHDAEGVVIRSADKQTVIQPLLTSSYEVEEGNATGATVRYKGVSAIFDLAAVAKMRQAGNGEFFVTVISDGNQNEHERDLKAKTKDFKYLPGL